MKINIDESKISSLLTRAVGKVIIEKDLKAKLKSGRVLRIKFGIDPTSPDIHIGHSVSLLKLRRFQELGHKIILIIGDFTARIGDPSGRSEARKPLSEMEIKKNFKNYLSEAGKIIDIKKTEVHFNSEWFGKMNAADFFQLASHMTIQQVLKREDFRKRIAAGQDIVSTEMMYPLFQGYDSVMVRADIEIGGEDQVLNLLAGRKIQRAYEMPEQDILTTWLIEGTDGINKMSKSHNNYIGISEKPNVMFGKVMSIPDGLIIKYFRALTEEVDYEIDKFELDLKSNKVNPRDIKFRLAREIVKMYHGEERAKKAAEEFERVFSKKQLPEKIPVVKLKRGIYTVVDLLIKLGLTNSKSEARRLMNENAVKIDNKTINDFQSTINITSGFMVQVGKRRFVKISLSN